MKKLIFLLFLTLSIQFLNANPPQKEYLFKPDSIWGTDLLGMIISSDFYTYHNNHIGTPLFLTDLNGNKVWEAKTDSFGQVEITLSGIENNIRLAGQYFDVETGFIITGIDIMILQQEGTSAKTQLALLVVLVCMGMWGRTRLILLTQRG